MSVELDRPVFLLGMPRSGTTWLSQIFESNPAFLVRLSPPYAYEFRGRLNEDSDAAAWRAVLSEAARSTDRFVTQNLRRDTGELCYFEKTDATRLAVKDTRFHALYQKAMGLLPEARLIYIVRHPAGALWSWRNCKEFPEGADFAAEWRHGACRKQEGPGEYWGFEDWTRLTRHYLAAAAHAPDRVRVLRYEQLVRDAEAEMEAVFDFLGMPLPEETRRFIQNSQSRTDARPYSVFRAKTDVDSWRGAFPEDILHSIEAELAGTELEALIR